MVATLEKLYTRLAEYTPAPRLYLKVTEEGTYVNPGRAILGTAIFALSRGVTASEYLAIAREEGVEVVVHVDSSWVPLEIYERENELQTPSWGKPWWVSELQERGVTYGSDALTPQAAEELAKELLAKRAAAE
jgi:hypothetical protein